jgi:oligoendopeptidase F
MASKRTYKKGRSGPSPQLQRLGHNASAIVKAAAELLDEELAAGIVTAKQMQKRFRDERRVDAKDLRPALDRLTTDAQGLLSVLEEQFGPTQSKETTATIRRFLGQSQSLLQVVFELVGTATEVATQLANAQLASASRERRREAE